ncbi:hypothetical protein Tco_0871029 [Tanacetum coccineum]
MQLSWGYNEQQWGLDCGARRYVVAEGEIGDGEIFWFGEGGEICGSGAWWRRLVVFRVSELGGGEFRLGVREIIVDSLCVASEFSGVRYFADWVLLDLHSISPCA